MELRRGYTEKDIPDFLPVTGKNYLQAALRKREAKKDAIRKDKEVIKMRKQAEKALTRGKGVDAKILVSGEKYIKDTKNLVEKYVKGDLKNLPIDILIQYKKAGLTNKAIATLVGVDENTIQVRLGPYKEEIKALEVFKKNKIDVLTLLQRRILLTFTEEDVDLMSAKERTALFSTVFDKTRVEEGKPTNTVTTHFNFLQQFTSPTNNPENLIETSETSEGVFEEEEDE